MVISGVLPPIATPFDEHGALDVRALRENIARWNTTGLSGYVVGGTNGESVMLEPGELAEAVRVVRGAALPEQTVVAGTGGQSTAATIRTTLLAAEAGADFALVMNPSYFAEQVPGNALVRHFTAVADASPIPVLLYNVPRFTHANIPVRVIAELSRHPNIAGIKDSAGDIGQVIDIVRDCADDFSVLVGSAAAFLASLDAGASGGVLGLANVAPNECVEIMRLAQSGAREQARMLHTRMMQIGKAVTVIYGIAGLKAALDLLGYYGGPPRPPLLPADAETRAAVARALADAGLRTESTGARR